MTIRQLLHSLPVSRFLLGLASLMVPGRSREEWLKEWYAELWQVSHACADRSRVNAEATSFCLGAFQDALWLRRNHQRPCSDQVSGNLRAGSAMRCGLFLAAWAVTGLLICLSFTGTRRVLIPSSDRDAGDMVILSRSGYAGIQEPAIRLSDYRLWKTKTHRTFPQLAFYQPIAKQIQIGRYKTAPLSIARASDNLFQLLNLPISAVPAMEASRSYKAQLILSRTVWHNFFGGDPGILGRICEIAGQPVLIAGIISDDSWRMPGQMDAWLLENEDAMEALPASSKGFVLGRLDASRFPASSDKWRVVTILRTDGTTESFDCISLAQQTQLPFSISAFALLLACLALPATTPLPLGEYPVRHDRLSLSIRARRWIFLGIKIALILPVVGFCSVGVAYSLSGPSSSRSIYLQCISSFFGFLFAFRWALRDQRKRCPVCLRLLSNPARVGQASHSFLAWNGIELMCSEGHGLLHIPELPTSWCSSQRWVYLDHSWRSLFPGSYAAVNGTR
jgi:hypothetical protein